MKTFKCLLIVSILSFKFLNSSASLLNVTGGSVSSTTWNEDTVKVNGNVTISGLTISPGTKVIITGHYTFTINGHCNISGLLNDSILFTVSDTTGYSNSSNTNGSWGGITVSLSSNDSIIFNYCKFQYIKQTGQYPKGISFSNGKSFYLKNSNFSNNQACIYGDTKSNMYIDSCKFYRNSYFSGSNTAVDIYFWNCNNVNVSNSNIIANSWTTIRAVGTTGNIVNNKFSDVGFITNNISVEGGSNLKITGNKFHKITGSVTNAITVTGSVATINSNSIILSNISNGLNLTASSSGVINYNKIDSCKNGINSSASTFNIYGDTITHSSQRAMFLATFSRDSISNNIIKLNAKGFELNQAKVTIYNSIFTDNTSSALFLNNSTLDIINTLIANNNASNGSAITALYSAINITNSTVANNSDNGSTNAPLTFTSSSGNVTNTIIWGNKANSTLTQVNITNNSVQPSFYNCDIEGSSTGFILGSGVTFTNDYKKCLNSDPLFVNPTTDAGTSYDALGAGIDWTVSTSSPCINVGLSDKNLLTKDLNNKSRIQNGIIDIGAYETLIPKYVYGGGTISGTVHWNADTVIINSNFTIDNTGSLIIDPGTVVLFSGNYKITCNGLVQANGNASNNIIFSKTDTIGYYKSDGTGGWGGFVFNNDVTEDDTSKFLYCQFQYVKGTININDRNKVQILNNKFFNSNGKYSGSSYLININNSNIQFNNNQFYNINDYNIIVYATSSIMNINNNNLHNINSAAIFYFSQTDIKFLDNYLYNDSVTSGSNPVIRCDNCQGNFINNIIFNNSAAGIFNFSNMVNCYIANNTITKNRISSFIFYIANAIVENNIIVNNTSQTLFGNNYTPSTFRNNYVSIGTTISSSPSTCSACIYDNNPFFIAPTNSVGISGTVVNSNWNINSFSKAINNGYSDISKLPSADYAGNDALIVLMLT